MQDTRNYKDGFFRSLFGTSEQSDERFLDLYNGLFGTNLTMENTAIKNVSLESVPSVLYRNDVAKLINGQLVALFEHQSTINENMSLRFLEYIDAIYKLLRKGRENGKYQRRRLDLPRPVFVVLYNGRAKEKENRELKLSDAFTGSGGINLELVAQVFNVNLYSHSPLLEKSSAAFGYAALCAYIEEAKAKGFADATARGVNKAISEGIFTEYLRTHFKEVVGMLDEEYDYEKDLKEYAQAQVEVIVERALRKGFDIDTISELTGLDIDLIKEIQSQVMA